MRTFPPLTPVDELPAELREAVAQLQRAGQREGRFAIEAASLLTDGTVRPLRQTEADPFLQWFGQSQVVTADGSPKIVYHGTDQDFHAFETKTGYRGDGGIFEVDVLSPFKFFSEDIDYAYDVARRKNGNRLIRAYLKMESPLDLTTVQGRMAAHDLFGIYDTEPKVVELAERIENLKSEAQRYMARAARAYTHYVRRDAEGNIVAAAASQKEGYERIDVTAEQDAQDKRDIADELLQEVAQLQQELHEAVGTFEQPEAVWELFDEAESAHKLAAAGFDGVIFREVSGELTYAVTGASQIKSADRNIGTFDIENPDIRFERTAPVFYSALARGIAGHMPRDKHGAISPEQALNWIAARAKEGRLFKSAEVEWSGVKEYLSAITGKVAVDDIVSFVKTNGVQVQEVIKREVVGFGVFDGAGALVQDGFADRRSAYDYGDENNIDGWYVRDAEASRDDPSSGLARYGNHTLPGGTDYRELLLTLPRQSRLPSEYVLVPAAVTEFDKQYGGGRERWEVKHRDTGVILASADSQEAAIEIALVNGGRSNEHTYRHNHWTEENVLVHVRFNERMDSDGRRVLFVEELQSDWGQQGKRKGFANERQFEVVQSGPQRFVVTNSADGSRVELPGGVVAFVTREDAQAAIDDGRAAKGYGIQRGLPRAPFVGETKAWVALAIKRVIRYAAENGFDRVAFISGQQSADRFDLSKHVDAVRVRPMPFQQRLPTYELVAHKDGDIAITREVHSLADLDEIIGKNAASIARAQIEQQGHAQLTGLDLKVGGDGMKVFYDRIVPQVAREVVRGLGGPALSTFTVRTADHDRVVNALGEDQSEVQVRRDAVGNWLVERGESHTIAGHGRYWDGQGWSQDDGAARIFKTREEALASALGTPQIGFDITPEMVEGAMAGLPLFSRQRARMERTALERWFADSKVVDDDGMPLQVYHGTSHDIAVFEEGHGWYGKGIYFTGNPEWASEFAQEGGIDNDGGDNVIPAYLSLQNPWVFEERISDEASNVQLMRELGMTTPQIERAMRTEEGVSQAIRDTLEGMGHDGLIVLSADLRTEYVAFHPTQIKSSVGNDGRYASDDPDIRFSRQRVGSSFQRWLAGSAVVDEAGMPMVVYHGTTRGDAVAAFDTRGSELGAHFGTQAQANAFAQREGGAILPVYLSIRNPLRLVDHGDFKAETVAMQLRELGLISADERAAISVELQQQGDVAQAAVLQRLQRRIQDRGYDGIVYLNRREGEHDPFGPDGVTGDELDAMTDEDVRDLFPTAADSYIAFEPGQVKSAIGNNGAFDPVNPDIRFSRQRGADAFSRWFGNSVVVADDGRPLQVFHGSAADIAQFNDRNLGRGTGAAWAKLGHYFTADADLASLFAKGKNWNKPRAGYKRGGIVLPVYLSLQNPKYLPAHVMLPLSGSPDKIAALRANLVAEGHDGVIIGAWSESFDTVDPTGELASPQYVAFYSHQIKSAIGNVGTFNPQDPDIRFSRARVQPLQEWFGKSTVVDVWNRPLVVYHGTKNVFDEFSRDAIGENGADIRNIGDWGDGFYFTKDVAYANGVAMDSDAEGTPNVRPVLLKIENPITDVDLMKLPDVDGMLADPYPGESLVSILTQHGYDGIVVRGGEEYVVFDPSQIRSAIGEGLPLSPQPTPLMDPHLSVDNPAGRWLEAKRAEVEADGLNQFGTPARFGSITGSFDRYVLLPVALLKTFRGLRNEERRVRYADLQWLVECGKETGRFPVVDPSSGETYNPFIQVDKDGTPWINEGNHRVMAAAALGWDYVPVQVRYFTGGERVPGALAPAKVLQFDRQAREAGCTTQLYGGRKLAEQLRFQRVWHGSPHAFSRFSTDAIGSGEGAQSYGWGLYFAGAQAVADYYRITTGLLRADTESVLAAVFPNRRFTTKERAQVYKAAVGDDPLELAGRRLQYRMASLRDVDTALLGQAIARARAQSRGRIYEVEIPDDDAFLSWDAAVSDQSERVKEALRQAGSDIAPALTFRLRQMDDGRWVVTDGTRDVSRAVARRATAERQLLALSAEHAQTGQSIYQSLSERLEKKRIAPIVAQLDTLIGRYSVTANAVAARLRMDPEERVLEEQLRAQLAQASGSGSRLASEYLRRLGIVGIRYLDGFSRDQGDGTQNYVVFDAQHADIVAPLQSDVAESPEFTAWFRSSKAVDGTGQPLVVYHGTSADIAVVDPTRSELHAAFFTADAQYASRVAEMRGDGANVMPVYLSLQDPLYVKDTDYSFEVVRRARREGHDGLITVPTESGHAVYVVFDASQVKSALGNTGAFSVTNPDLRFQRVWHGTPHRFERFSMDAIGTGEGAQAYGWGLYFSGERAVADFYRKKLSNGEPGRIYAAEIPEDQHFLLWDAALSEQSAEVMQALRGAAIAPDEEVWPAWTGEQLYTSEVQARMVFDKLDKATARRATSDALRALGVAGIQYLDADSRSVGAGSYNYVVFSEDSVEVVAEIDASAGASLAFQTWFRDSKIVDRDGMPLMVFHGTTADFTTFESFAPTDVYTLDEDEIARADGWDMGDDRMGKPEAYHYLALSHALQLGAQEALALHEADVQRLGLTGADTDRLGRDLRRLVGKRLERRTESRPSGDGFYFTPDLSYSFVRDIGRHDGGNVMPVYLSIRNPVYVNASQVEGAGASFNVEKYKAQGYDGAIFADYPEDLTRRGWNGATQIVAFYPEQIKSAIGNNGDYDPDNADIRFQRQRSAGLATEDADAFQRWFGSSKVVDSIGKPLVLYHSTDADFSAFAKTSDIGFHFGTAGQAEARAASRGNDRTMPVYLAIQNPLEMPDLGDWDFWRFTEDGMPNAYCEMPDGTLGVAFSVGDVEYVADRIAEHDSKDAAWEWLRSYFEAKGYDGIKYQNVGETEDQTAGDYSYIAFRPEQIKSAIGNNGDYDPENADIRFQRVWHGSPHDFDAFRVAAVGTGEGNQVFGHGIYFASRKEIADTYRNVLSLPYFDGRPADSALQQELMKTDEIMAYAVSFVGIYGSVNAAKAQLQKEAEEGGELGRDGLRWLNDNEHRFMAGGQLYEAEIPEDDAFLRWDLPLYLQSAKVKQGLRDMADDEISDEGIRSKMVNALQFEQVGQPTGELLYRVLSESVYRDEKATSEVLSGYGIAGISYPDAATRGMEDMSLNYVVFDEAKISLSKKHIQPNKRLTADALRWLDGTKVVDENGQPMVVYHGTKAAISAFDPSKTVDGGIHFGSSEQAQMRASGAGKNLVPVYLRMTNPRRSRDTGGQWRQKIASAKAAGHDGIVYLNRYEGIPSERITQLASDGVLQTLDALSDKEFKRLVPEARDSYIAFSAAQIRSVIDVMEPVEQIKQEDMMKLEFTEETTAAYSGQVNLTLSAYVGEEIVGAIDYVKYGSDISVSYIVVAEKHRRHGYATALMQQLQAQYPDTEIKMGLLTNDGAAWYDKLPKFEVELPGIAAKYSQLTSLMAERDRLSKDFEDFYANPDATETERTLLLGKASSLNDIHDAIDGLESELHGARSTKTLITLPKREPVPLQEAVDALRRVWTDKGLESSIGCDSKGDLSLSKIVAAQPKQGIGTAFMTELVALADQYGARIRLTPALDFGATSIARLKRFYKRFGFVENRGRNKDFSISESMYRVAGSPTDEKVNFLRSAKVPDAQSSLSPELGAVKALAGVFGSKVALFRLSKDSQFRFNGVKMRDTIWLNETSDKPLHVVFGHELLHLMRSERPDLYSGLYGAIKPLLTNEAAYIGSVGLQGYPRDEVHEEMIADLLGDRFAEPAFWKRVADHNPSLFRGIAAYVTGFIDNIKEKLGRWPGDGTLQSTRFVSDLDRARELLACVVATYGRDKHAAARQGFFESIRGATGVQRANKDASLDLERIGKILAEDVDDRLKSIFASVTGEEPSYVAVFEWLQSKAFDGSQEVQDQLLAIAVERGYDGPRGPKVTSMDQGRFVSGAAQGSLDTPTTSSQPSKPDSGAQKDEVRGLGVDY